MRFIDYSQRKVMPCSRQQFRSLFIEFYIDPPLVSWNDSKTSYEAYPIASRARVTREATRIPRWCLNSWTRFEPLSLIAE
jgi:hypothetical protein